MMNIERLSSYIIQTGPFIFCPDKANFKFEKPLAKWERELKEAVNFLNMHNNKFYVSIDILTKYNKDRELVAYDDEEAYISVISERLTEILKYSDEYDPSNDKFSL